MCIARVCFKCFICFKHMLQVFYQDIAYVAVAIHICCKCVFQMFQLFHLYIACFYLDVAYVPLAIHICCKCIFQMFHLFHTDVVSVLAGCCYMLQCLYTYVANVCFHCFTRFQYVAAGVVPHAL
jgi:hypothetical protein